MTRVQADERERAARRRIGELADEWRRVARGVPYWEVDRAGDEIVLREHGHPLATLHGPWASRVADYLQAMNSDAGIGLAELLWRIGGHGDARDIRGATEDLLRYMRIDEVRRDR